MQKLQKKVTAIHSFWTIINSVGKTEITTDVIFKFGPISGVQKQILFHFCIQYSYDSMFILYYLIYREHYLNYNVYSLIFLSLAVESTIRKAILWINGKVLDFYSFKPLDSISLTLLLLVQLMVFLWCEVFIDCRIRINSNSTFIFYWHWFRRSGIPCLSCYYCWTCYK